MINANYDPSQVFLTLKHNPPGSGSIQGESDEETQICLADVMDLIENGDISVLDEIGISFSKTVDKMGRTVIRFTYEDVKYTFTIAGSGNTSQNLDIDDILDTLEEGDVSILDQIGCNYVKAVDNTTGKVVIVFEYDDLKYTVHINNTTNTSVNQTPTYSKTELEGLDDSAIARYFTKNSDSTYSLNATNIKADFPENEYGKIDSPAKLKEAIAKKAEAEKAETETNGFATWNELSSWLHSGARTEFETKYQDIKFKGGCQAAAIVASNHKNDFNTVSKEELLEELHAEYLRLYPKEVISTSSEETRGGTSVSGFKATELEGLDNSTIARYFTKNSDSTYSLNATNIKADFPENEYGKIDSPAKLKEAIAKKAEAEKAETETETGTKTETVSGTNGFETWSQIIGYLCGGAKAEFEAKYQDIKFKGGCQAAENVANNHRNDFNTVSKEELLEELHAEYLKLYNNGVNGTNNTSAAQYNDSMSKGHLCGKHGLSESIVKELFINIGDDNYILNMSAVTKRFPNSNIETIQDLIDAYQNYEIVYSEIELKNIYGCTQERINFFFKQNKDGTYSLDAEKLKYWTKVVPRDISYIIALSDLEIGYKFYEIVLASSRNNTTYSGADIKQYINTCIDLMDNGFRSKPGGKSYDDEELYQQAVELAIKNLNIEDDKEYNLSTVINTFDNLIQDIYYGTSVDKSNANSAIDEAVTQGNTQDCWLLSGVLALNNTPNGKQILKDSIKVNQDGSITVSFKGIGVEYTIPLNELLLYDADTYYSNQVIDLYSHGDNDMLAIELAVRKLQADINNGKVVLDVDANSFEGYSSNSLNGGYAQQLLYLFTGNTSQTKVAQYSENASDEVKQAALAKGLSSNDIIVFLDQNSSNTNALTFSMYYSKKTAKCTDGSTFSADLTQNGHTYVITNIDAQNSTVTFIDPNDTTKSYTMSWNEFSKMGIGMVSSTSTQNVNVHKQETENKYSNQEIIDIIYKNFGSVGSDTISLQEFTNELFSDNTSLYNVSLALIQQNYPGAKDLSNFKDVLLNIAQSANFSPENFVNLLSEKLSDGSFDKAVDSSTQKKNLYTDLVTSYLLSLGESGTVNINDFYQILNNRKSNYGDITQTDISNILSVFSDVLLNALSNIYPDLSIEDFNIMLTSNSIKMSDLCKGLSSDKAISATGVTLNAAIQNSAAEASAAAVANATTKSIQAQNYANDNYDINGFNQYGIHRITGTIYDPEGYNKDGYDENGYDRDGFNENGIHKDTGTKYDPEGFDEYGYDENGYNRDGFDENGIHKDTGTEYNPEGFDEYGYDKLRYDIDGYDDDGYDENGYDRDGFNENGIHKDTGTEYDPYGIDEYGFYANYIHSETGTKYDPDGYDAYGYDKYGYDRNGYDKYGINKDGRDMNGELLTEEEKLRMIISYMKRRYDDLLDETIYAALVLPKLSDKLEISNPIEIAKSKSIIREWIDNVTETLGTASNAVVGFLNELYDSIKVGGAKIIEVFSEIGKTIEKGTKSLFNFVKELFNSVKEVDEKDENKTGTSTQNTEATNKPSTNTQLDDIFNDNSDSHTTSYKDDGTTVIEYYTECGGYSRKTGEVIRHPDGSKEYYDINQSGELELVRMTYANGMIVDYSDGKPVLITYPTGLIGLLDDNGNPIVVSPTVAIPTFSTSQESSNQKTFNHNDYLSSVMSGIAEWAANGGNTDLAKSLQEWINNGCQGNFTWSASTSSSNSTNNGLNSSSGGSSNGITTGGYCPDGSWSPIAGTGYGSIADGVIGVGGHGGTPVLEVLGGGSGWRGNSGSYHRY